jgi:hypothetical protein
MSQGWTHDDLTAMRLTSFMNQTDQYIILLHFTFNYDQFSILCANICQFYKFTFKILKLLKFLKVLNLKCEFVELTSVCT